MILSFGTRFGCSRRVVFRAGLLGAGMFCISVLDNLAEEIVLFTFQHIPGQNLASSDRPIIFIRVLSLPQTDLPLQLFLNGMGSALFWSAFVWLNYMAIEQYVRWHWPNLLIGWNRVLVGR